MSEWLDGGWWVGGGGGSLNISHLGAKILFVVVGRMHPAKIMGYTYERQPPHTF